MFASKSDYRIYFASVSKYVKMSYFLKKVGISSSAFSRFQKGKPYDHMISLNKLDDLYQEIKLKLT